VLWCSDLSFVVSDGLDAAGNVYIADTNNFTIDRLTPPAAGLDRRPGDRRHPPGRPDAQHRRRQLGQRPVTGTYHWHDCDGSRRQLYAVSQEVSDPTLAGQMSA
jgi:hypothetical protein